MLQGATVQPGTAITDEEIEAAEKAAPYRNKGVGQYIEL